SLPFQRGTNEANQQVEEEVGGTYTEALAPRVFRQISKGIDAAAQVSKIAHVTGFGAAARLRLRFFGRSGGLLFFNSLHAGSIQSASPICRIAERLGLPENDEIPAKQKQPAHPCQHCHKQTEIGFTFQDGSSGARRAVAHAIETRADA